LEAKVNEVISALDTMETATKTEFEELQKELESVASPIMVREPLSSSLRITY